MKIISYGGGVQSTALLVLAVQGDLGKVDAALFANVGDDSEHPDTLRYVREVAQPWVRAEQRSHLGDVLELRRQDRHGAVVDGLYSRMMKSGSKSVPIPMRGSEVGAPGARACTVDWKLKVIGRWLLQHGCSPDQPADVLIGFSLDEIHRVTDRPATSRMERCQRKVYPLLDMRLTRHDCQQIIAKAGLPVPPKSSCYFCPYHKPSVWATMRRDEPELFDKSADLEATINARREAAGRTKVYLTRFGKPLVDAIPEDTQTSLDFGTGPGETCDEGYCWT
jgi:hypothetical protein